jgi:ATP-binding cassette subfamily F protein 3
LIEATADRLLLVADGTVTQFDGDLDDYRRFLLSGENTPTRRVETPRPTREDTRKESAARRRHLKPLKDKVEAAEHQISDLTTELAKLDRALADPLLFTKDPAKGNAVSKKRADAARKLKAAEELWLKCNEDYESALRADA